MNLTKAYSYTSLLLYTYVTSTIRLLFRKMPIKLVSNQRAEVKEVRVCAKDLYHFFIDMPLPYLPYKQLTLSNEITLNLYSKNELDKETNNTYYQHVTRHVKYCSCLYRITLFAIMNAFTLSFFLIRNKEVV